MSGLTNDTCVNSSVNNDSLADCIEFLTLEEVATAVCELLLNLVIDAVENGNRLLRSADHAVVEGLRVNDGVNCKLDVCGVINDSWSVTCTNTQSRLTRRISSVNHTWATGC